MKKRYNEFINSHDLTPIKSETDEDYKQYFDSIKKKLYSKYKRNLSFYSIDNMSFLTFEEDIDIKFDKIALTMFAALIGWIAVSTVTPPEGYTGVKFISVAKNKNNKIKLNEFLNYSVFLKK